jgi:hypothetical protein
LRKTIQKNRGDIKEKYPAALISWHPVFAFRLDSPHDFVYASSPSKVQYASSTVNDLIDIEESIFSRN